MGAGLRLGLRPRTAAHPPAGTKGAVMFGLETYAPIEHVTAPLSTRRVRMTEIGNFVDIEDSDGNAIHLWEIVPELLGKPREDDAGEAPSTRTGGTFFGAHANVYVTDMDRAVRFYTEVLGLPLTNRFGDNWATVEAGRTLVIGLHPQSPKHPPPGTKGSTVLGLTLDEPIERAMGRLAQRGVRLAAGIVADEGGRSVCLEDPDGNQIELQDGAAVAAGPSLVATAGRT